MESGRPLRDVFAELLDDESARQAYAADPDGFLGSYGHADLPAPLVTEAIVSFADTASAELAEYLAPFVVANAAAPMGGAATSVDEPHGLDVLADAPLGLGVNESTHAQAAAQLDDAFDAQDRGELDMGDGDSAEGPPLAPDASLFDLDFGGGTSAAILRADEPATADAGPGEPEFGVERGSSAPGLGMEPAAESGLLSAETHEMPGIEMASAEYEPDDGDADADAVE